MNSLDPGTGKGTDMELEQLKAAWQSLDRRLELDNRLRLEEYRERKTDRVRDTLRPMFWTQGVQVAFGVVVMLMGAACWARYLHIPALFAAGLVMHAYGLLVVVLGCLMIGHLRALDFSEPVVVIQARLVELQRRLLLTGTIAGLAWWVLWIPMLLVVAGLAAFNIPLPPGAMPIAAWVWWALAVGVCGMLGILGLYWWSGTPGHESLRRKLDHLVGSPRLREAQARMDELARFEAE